jgi:CheY-like chemotaxis protein
MAATHSNGRGLDVLVVDDDRDTADSVALLLRLHGHAAHVAHSGPDALHMAEQQPPDVVLLDIGLPGLDGYEVAKRLRAMPWERRPLLIALTGFGTDRDRRRSAEAGIDLHWVKPADPEWLRLLDRLGEILSPPKPMPMPGANRLTSGSPAHDGGSLIRLSDLARFGRREERAGAVRQFGERVKTAVIRCRTHLAESRAFADRIADRTELVRSKAYSRPTAPAPHQSDSSEPEWLLSSLRAVYSALGIRKG